MPPEFKRAALGDSYIAQQIEIAMPFYAPTLPELKNARMIPKTVDPTLDEMYRVSSTFDERHVGTPGIAFAVPQTEAEQRLIIARRLSPSTKYTRELTHALDHDRGDEDVPRKWQAQPPHTWCTCDHCEDKLR